MLILQSEIHSIVNNMLVSLAQMFIFRTGQNKAQSR